MRDILVIINYMRSNPPIIDDYVLGLKNYYKKIYIVNRNTFSDYENIKDLESVDIREVKLCNRFLLIPKSIIALLGSSSLDDIKYCRKNNMFSMSLLLYMAKFHHIVTLLNSVLNSIAEIRICPERVSILALFYTSEAYVAAQIKKKYPSIRAVSMAHSHEIGSFIDPAQTFVGKKSMQGVLDRICFISQRKMDIYIKNVCVPRSLPTDSFKLLYWGSKYIKFIDAVVETDYPIVVSCSTVEGLKRVSMIAKSILLCKNRDVHWYHFGDGAIMNELIKQVDSYPQEVKSRIHLMGRIPNLEVKRFYSTHDIALFINVSSIEGLPISVMEALSYGLPALVTDVGGEREIIEDGVNGYVVDASIKASQLSKLLDMHLNLSNKELVRQRNAAFSMWQSRFDLDQNLLLYSKELK